MAKLVACINVYNEEELLPMCLEHSLPLFDEFIIAEGAYVGRAKHPHSKDKTNAIIRKFKRTCGKPVKHILRNTFWQSEVSKRNSMLFEVGEGDWHAYMDGDWKPLWTPEKSEELRNLPHEINSCEVEILKPWMKNIQTGYVPRYKYHHFPFFRRLRGIHFAYNHATLCDGEGTFVWQDKFWKPVINLGIVYEEIKRKDHEVHRGRKRQMFAHGYEEYANGAGELLCTDCGHGNEVLMKVDGVDLIKGFTIDRGMSLKCPNCGGANLVNARFQNTRNLGARHKVDEDLMKAGKSRW